MGASDPFRERRRDPIELNRTEVRRLGDAARLLLQRTGSRREVERQHGISEAALATLIRGAQPWRVQPEMVAKLESALRLKPGDVLAGRAPKPADEPAPKKRRPSIHVHRSASDSAR